jgi:aspartokinase-like uncharacterized kinase
MLSVIKLGGSLLKAGYLPACLDAVTRHSGQILLVPGGGVFADQVRVSQQQWHFDDTTAHRMAILAMQQMALLIRAFKPEWGLLEDLTALKHMPRIAVWSPNLTELDRSDVGASWDITSDSLAAWLAGQVKANNLILVKSCQVNEDLEYTELQQQGVVDAGFLGFAQSIDCNITIINQARFMTLS